MGYRDQSKAMDGLAAGSEDAGRGSRTTRWARYPMPGGGPSLRREALLAKGQNGLAITRKTTKTNSNTGISLNHRNVREEGSGFPLAAPFSQRPDTV